MVSSPSNHPISHDGPACAGIGENANPVASVRAEPVEHGGLSRGFGVARDTFPVEGQLDLSSLSQVKGSHEIYETVPDKMSELVEHCAFSEFN
jgi:hypothetical protein